MAIYSNENIKKIVKLTHHKFPQLVPIRKNKYVCPRKYIFLWHLYSMTVIHKNTCKVQNDTIILVLYYMYALYLK